MVMPHAANGNSGLICSSSLTLIFQQQQQQQSCVGTLSNHMNDLVRACGVSPRLGWATVGLRCFDCSSHIPQHDGALVYWLRYVQVYKSFIVSDLFLVDLLRKKPSIKRLTSSKLRVERLRWINNISIISPTFLPGPVLLLASSSPPPPPLSVCISAVSRWQTGGFEPRNPDQSGFDLVVRHAEAVRLPVFPLIRFRFFTL